MIDKDMPVLTMKIVNQLTHLSARQIRYYEANELISPSRSEGGQRLYSIHDVELIGQVKLLIEKGFNMKKIKEELDRLNQSAHKSADETSPQYIEEDFSTNYIKKVLSGESREIPLTRGDLSRFYKQKKK